MKISPIAHNFLIKTPKRNTYATFQNRQMQDSVCFSGLTKSKNGLAQIDFFEKDIEYAKKVLFDAYDKKGGVDKSDIKSSIKGEVEIVSNDCLGNNSPIARLINAQVSENSDVFTYKINGTKYVNKVLPAGIIFYLPRLNRERLENIRDIIHEITHVKQYQKEPSKTLRTFVSEMSKAGLNYASAVINFSHIQNKEFAYFEIIQKEKLPDFYNIKGNICLETDLRKVDNPKKDLQRAFNSFDDKTLKEVLADDLDGQISFMTRCLIESSSELEGEFKRNPRKIIKQIKSVFKKTLIDHLCIEYSAYSNGFKAYKELRGIDYNIPCDTILELYKSMIEASKLLKY